MSLSIPVSVGYNSDIDKLERILTEEAKKAVEEVSGLLGDPEPVVRFIPDLAKAPLILPWYVM